MFTSWFDGSSLNVLIAFAAGFITFFASCLLPLVPTYLAYLSGVSLQSDEARQERWRIVRIAFFFVLGFTGTFVVLGALLNRFAALLVPYRLVIEKIAGFFFILMGLFILGLFKAGWLERERRFDFDKTFHQHRHLHAVIMGIGFGFGWTPCIGPVLALILFWAAQQASFWQGIILLISYGIGLGIPFLLVALGFEYMIPWLKKRRQITRVATIISGLIIIMAGALLFFGQFQRLSMILLELLGLNVLAV